MKNLFVALIICMFQSLSFSQWFEQTAPPHFNLFSFSFPSASTGFAVGYGNTMIKTTNGGTNWYNISIFPNTAQDLNSVWFINENSGWMCSTNDTLYRTTNSALTWTAQMKFPSYGQKIFFIDSSAGWILAQPNLYKTTNGGASWNIVNSQMGQYFTFINRNTGWMASYPGGGSVIHKTTDGGSSWIPQYSTTNFRVIYCLNFINENTGWAAGYREHILKTTNGGINWFQQRDMNNSVGLFSMDFINSNTGWAIGGSGYSLYTIDGGGTWNQVNLPVGTGNVKFINSNTGWTIGSRIFKTTTTGLVYKTLQLTALIEGLYDGASNTMVSDTITAFLKASSPPYGNVDSSGSITALNGMCTLNFVKANNGTNYFITLKHRNSIETWSSAANSFNSNSMSYDFTSSSSQAYGNNLKIKGSRWTIYSGDVNQDGVIDGTDLSITDNDSFNFAGGYIPSDLNGDNITDASDLQIVSNNSPGFISVIRP